MVAAGLALTAVEDDDGSDPTNGAISVCGAREGPEVCDGIEGSLPLDLAFGGNGVF